MAVIGGTPFSEQARWNSYTEQRETILAREDYETECARRTDWMRSAWAELAETPGLGSIENEEHLLLADHRDTEWACDLCGYTVVRGKAERGTWSHKR